MDDLVAFLNARLDEDERMALSASYWPDDECHPGPFAHDHWVRRHVNETGSANLVRTALETEGQPTLGTSADPIPDGWVKTHEVVAVAAISESRMPEYLARHIARHDPARVLAEVEAKRRIIEWHGRRKETHTFTMIDGIVTADLWTCVTCCTDTCPTWEELGQDHRDPDRIGCCDTIPLLALPFADHPDYLEKWKP